MVERELATIDGGEYSLTEKGKEKSEEVRLPEQIEAHLGSDPTVLERLRLRMNRVIGDQF